ncbi:MAG TPA: EAL domain-containing protein [Gemmatimonadales bacterium]|nr:EAL domain-containing protein [Gemmatimonadales bacterium]
MSQPPLRRILFVDDDRAVARAFGLTVRTFGYEADVAAAGAEAIRLARTRFYPIIVTDLRMPGMDGLTLIERLRPLCPATAFVILTGYPELDLRSSIMGDGAISSVVRKPWLEEELEVTLARAWELHQRRARRMRDEPGQVGAPRTVLLVEDNPGDADLAVEYLREEYDATQVVHLTRLEAAIEWLHNASVEAVISDLSLPDARGFDAVTRLCAAAPGVPVLVLSGLADEDLGQLVIQLGAQDFLVKGTINADILLRALRHARERKRGEQRLLELAQHDPLTGLVNRAAFRDRVTVACTRARRGGHRFGVMFIDLDRFKEVNDSLGHEAGDALLQEIGRRVEAAVRDYDTVARLGGDEFAVLVEDIESEVRVTELARRILDAFALPVRHEGRDIAVTGSVGIAVHPDAGRTTTDLLRAADEAMYLAKQSGRNRMQVYASGGGHANGGDPAHEVQLAVARGDFVLHFQPQVALPGGGLVGVEALLRWRRNGSLLSPGHFLAELEESGSIREVGAWVMGHACAQLAAWRAAGAPSLRLAVNLSARQLLAPEFLHTLQDTLAASAVPPAALDIEIPERTLMTLPTEANHRLDALRAMGVRLTVDGFGTGFSSPAHLVRHGIASLKIARSFVSTAPSDVESARLVRAIIGLGKSLDFDVVADGIETEAQYAFARSAGCTHGQGFLFGTPQAEWSPLM